MLMESQWNKQVTWKFAKKKLIRKYIIQTNYSHQMIYQHTPADYYELQKSDDPSPLLQQLSEGTGYNQYSF